MFFVLCSLSWPHPPECFSECVAGDPLTRPACHALDTSACHVKVIFPDTLLPGFQGSGAVSKLVAVTKKEKSEANKRRKQSLEVEEEDEENRDWWTKYFASLEAVAVVSTFLYLTFPQHPHSL